MNTELEKRVRSLLKQMEGFPLISPYGVCPHQELKLLMDEDVLPKGNSFEVEDIESSTLNLRNSDEIWEIGVMRKPGPSYTVRRMLQEQKARKIPVGDGAILQRNHTYVIKTQGEIDFKKYADNPHLLDHLLSYPRPESLQGVIEPKSSSGRIFLDIRGIVDYSDEYNIIPQNYKGEIYLFVTPLVNPCVVSSGDSLAQLITGTDLTPISGNVIENIHNQEWPLFWEDHIPVPKLTIRHNQVFVKPELGPKDGGDHVALRMVQHYSKKPIVIGKGAGTHSAKEFYERVHLGTDSNLYGRFQESLLVLTTPAVSVPPYLLMRMIQLPANQGKVSTHEAGLINAGDGFGGLESQNGSHMLCEITVDERSGTMWTPNTDITSFQLYRLRRPSDYLYQGKNYTQQEQRTIRLPKIFTNDL